jgi:hypothetical protein
MPEMEQPNLYYPRSEDLATGLVSLFLAFHPRPSKCPVTGDLFFAVLSEGRVQSVGLDYVCIVEGRGRKRSNSQGGGEMEVVRKYEWVEGPG